MSGRQCATCIWWGPPSFPDYGLAASGVKPATVRACRRHPPTAAAQKLDMATFPMTMPDWWCGEYTKPATETTVP